MRYKKNLILAILSLMSLLGAINLLFSQNEVPRDYNVLNYDLKLDWVDILPSTDEQPELRKWSGEIEIKLTPKIAKLDVIELDACGLEFDINSDGSALILYNNLSVDDIFDVVFWSYDGKLLICSLPSNYPLNFGDTAIIKIPYRYANLENRGFFHRNTPYQSKFIISRLVDIPSASTLNEPIDARYWYPCNDRPSDKAIFNVAVKVPLGYEVFSNGTNDSVVVSDDGMIATFYWSNAHPMPTYLFTVGASIYEKRTERMQINSTTTDSVDVHYWTWEGDWEGNTEYNVKRMLAPTAFTMQLFSDLFGDYPFEKYGIATADYALLGYSGLGMEHQTITTTSRSWYRTYLDWRAFPSLAHELGHHWFGDLVTCNTWQDLWWNEGAATWLEAIYLENIYTPNDKQRYYSHICNMGAAYLNKADTVPRFYFTPIYELSDATGIFDNTVLVYQKASNIFAMLREITGDDVFPLFRELLDKYRFGNITTEQFIDYWVPKIKEYNANIDIRKMLEQKIYSPGHPIYKIKTEQNFSNTKGNYIIDVTLTQIQRELYPDSLNLPEQFITYTEILFYGTNGNIIHREHWYNDKIEDSLRVELNVPVAFVRLNDSVSLHRIKNYEFTDVDEENAKNLINIFPNPTNTDLLNIQFNEIINSVKLIDMSGKIYLLNTQLIDNNAITQVNVQNLPKGTYIININEKHNKTVVLY